MSEEQMKEQIQQLNDTIQLLIEQRTAAVANAHNETVKFAVEMKALQRKIAKLEAAAREDKAEPELPLSNGRDAEEHAAI